MACFGDVRALTELNNRDLSPYFPGLEASLLIESLDGSEKFVLNPVGCKERCSPCSTFKIFNSLAGLETGVLRNENDSMKWSGKKYPVKSWNRDHTLQSAVTNSVVWYFQSVALRVGEKRMQGFLNKVGYGNGDITSGITQFWLGKSLQISCDEQVSFLKRLVKDELPFSRRSMAIVRGMLRLEQTAKGTLYGKTGSDMQDGKKVLGWFVGYVVNADADKGKTFVFATRIEGEDGAWGPEARKITRKILGDLEML